MADEEFFKTEEEDEKPEEPSVLSSDASERKMARRLRIQKRMEALKRQDTIEDESINEATAVEKQLLASEDLLEKWLAESDEVVTNVRVANDARENERRTKEDELREQLLTKLTADAEKCMNRFNIINERWMPLLDSNDPLDIRNAMLDQSARCLEVLAQKDAVIAELKEQIKRADEAFIDDQKLQRNDIDLLIDRINNQVNFMSKAYRRELVLIESIVEKERKVLMDSIQKKWDALFKKRGQIEMDGYKKRKKIIRCYEAELKREMIDHHETYRELKISREAECQKLQQHVEQIKALCLLNSEKLHYNYTVLKCREDENTIIKNQQKRKLNKLQDITNSLKRQYAEVKAKTKHKRQSLTDQLKKAHKGISEMQEKANIFSAANEKQYMDVWDMNSRAADDLVNKIYAADKIIFEQVLGLKWKRPNSSILKMEELPSYIKAVKAIEMKKKADETQIIQLKPPKNLLNEEKNQHRKLLRHILQSISDHSGFLIEHKLQDILKEHTDEEKLIIRLDNVFRALGVSVPEQIDVMLQYFIPFCYCPICTEKETSDEDLSETELKSECSSEREICTIEELSPEARKLIDVVIEESGPCPCDDIQEKSTASDLDSVTKITEPVTCSDTKIDTNAEADVTTGPGTDVDTDIEVDTITHLSTDDEKPKCKQDVRKVVCDNGHLLQIKPVMVMKALKEFMASSDPKNKGKTPLAFEEKLKEQRLTISRNITTEDVTKYWTSYQEVFDGAHEQLWDAVSAGLTKYHDILKERHELNTEIECLRRQNEELRRLLKSYAVKTDNFMPTETKSASQVT